MLNGEISPDGVGCNGVWQRTGSRFVTLSVMNKSIQSLEQFRAQIRSGDLSGATRLQLSCGLKDFPVEIFDLADSLEILDLSGNALSRLPDRLPELRKLKILFCSFNQFTELPKVLGQCKELSMVGFRNNRIMQVSGESLPPLLRWLILTGNRIESLPQELGHRPRLQKLMVAGNRLQSLPNLSECTNLELIRIAANRFEALPSALLSLPRLSWISYSGNPFCAEDEQIALRNTPVKHIPWASLSLRQKLGEGASGVIYQAQMRDESESVAVKLFKGELTSDGLPVSEMAACMKAGMHPNLIEVLGKIDGHPDGANGLVMSLVDDSYRNLAGPPSFESCTRDVYAEDLRFSAAEVVRIASGIAGVAKQLHAKGIMHGDLYGHNILIAQAGHALLGDFGAACFKPDEANQRLALEKIEIRAFGYLLEELLQRCDRNDAMLTDSHALTELQDICDDCLSLDLAQRPGFMDIAARLDQLIYKSEKK